MLHVVLSASDNARRQGYIYVERVEAGDAQG